MICTVPLLKSKLVKTCIKKHFTFKQNCRFEQLGHYGRKCNGYIQGRIYYEANEASASGPHHLRGPHQNFNAVSKVDFHIA